jgi:hypothetical protein
MHPPPMCSPLKTGKLSSNPQLKPLHQQHRRVHRRLPPRAEHRRSETLGSLQIKFKKSIGASTARQADAHAEGSPAARPVDHHSTGRNFICFRRRTVQPQLRPLCRSGLPCCIGRGIGWHVCRHRVLRYRGAEGSRHREKGSHPLARSADMDSRAWKVLTPILGAMALSQQDNGQKVHGIAAAHSAVAVTTFAAYGASIVAVSWPIHVKFWEHQ